MHSLRNHQGALTRATSQTSEFPGCRASTVASLYHNYDASGSSPIASNLGIKAHPKNPGTTVSCNGIDCPLLPARLWGSPESSTSRPYPPWGCFTQGRFVPRPRIRTSKRHSNRATTFSPPAVQHRLCFPTRSVRRMLSEYHAKGSFEEKFGSSGLRRIGKVASPVQNGGSLLWLQKTWETSTCVVYSR